MWWLAPVPMKPICRKPSGPEALLDSSLLELGGEGGLPTEARVCIMRLHSGVGPSCTPSSVIPSSEYE